MTISPERLRELNRKIGTGPGGTDMTYMEEMQFLRELEQRRLAMAGVDAGTHCIVPMEPAPEAFEAWLRIEEWPEVYRAMLSAAPEKEPAQEKQT